MAASRLSHQPTCGPKLVFRGAETVGVHELYFLSVHLMNYTKLKLRRVANLKAVVQKKLSQGALVKKSNCQREESFRVFASGFFFSLCCDMSNIYQ